MADQLITKQELIEAQKDVKNAGEAVNTKKVITPRYGDPFKSIPLVVEEGEQKTDAAVAALNAKANEVVAKGFYTGYATETALKASLPAVSEMRARADDTRKIWRWNRTSAEGITPVTGIWTDTGPSDVDVAVEQFIEEAQRQGVALNQLDDYYNYLMQRLAQIAVDKGWEASFVVDASGENQQIINDQRFNNPYINVLNEGVLPNSPLDQSVKIKAADLKAKNLGKKLFFPAGTYLGSGFNPESVWEGAGANLTRIKHFNPTSAYTGFISSTKLKPYSIIKGITFDGAVSADPMAWNSSNYNSFTGAIAYSLAYSSFIYFQECNFENSFWSNVRIEKCENIFLINCNTKKARGNFGDGVYTYNSKGIYEINCTAEDFTRIGFVKEQNSHNSVQINCHAKNGHDGSILYGGGEYNAGFWNENSSNSELAYCTANNIRHYGFITSTGTVVTSNGNDYWHALTNCTSKNCDSGFVGQSFAGAPVTKKYQNCKSFNSTFPFNISTNNAADIYVLDGCTSDMDWNRQIDGTIKGLIISGTARGKVKIRNTMFSRKNAVLADLADKTKYISDIIHFGAVQQDVEVIDCYTDDGSAIVIKQINASGKIGLNIRDSKVDLRKIAAMNTKFKAANCEIVYADLVNSAESKLTNCDISGSFTASISDKISFNGGSYAANADSEFMFIVSSVDTKKLLTHFTNGFSVKKNIATGDYALRLQFEGFNKPLSILNGVIFENTGGVITTDKTFVWCPRSKDASQTVVGSTNILYQNVIKDVSVTHIQKTNTTLVDDSTITGLTPVVF